MINLIRSQFLQLRTTRTFWWLVAAALFLTVGLQAIYFASVDSESARDVSTTNTGSASMFMLIIGLVGATGAFRHGTAVVEALAIPSRAKALISKLVVYGVVGILLAIVVLLLTTLIGSAFPKLDHVGTTTWFHEAGYETLRVMLSGLIGVVIGSVVRSQIGAVVGTLVYFFIINPTILALTMPGMQYRGQFWAKVYSFTLGGADSDLSADKVNMATGTWMVHARYIGALIICAWVVLFFVSALGLDRRRDLA